MIITTVGHFILNGQYIRKAVVNQPMWPFRDHLIELSDAIHDIIWSTPQADPSRHCYLMAQFLYPNEYTLLDNGEVPMFCQDITRLFAYCEIPYEKGVLLSNYALSPYIYKGQRHLLFQRCDLSIIYYDPQELLVSNISINVTLIGDTLNIITTIMIDINKMCSYDDFINRLVQQPAFKENLPSTYHRLHGQGYHLPRDIELYYVPREINHELLRVLNVLVDRGDKGVFVQGALLRIGWAGNAQRIHLGDIFADQAFNLLIAPVKKDILAWTEKQAYAHYKDNMR
jgi:hypothetical protein